MPKAFDMFLVKPSLPGRLWILRDIAYNLYWTWNWETAELFYRLDRELWNATNHNPVKLLGSISQDKLEQAVADEGYLAELERQYWNLQEYLSTPAWFENNYGKYDSPKIAYFSMEFGLTECLPIYSGGLGVLAGDHLKSASDLGLPLVGVGLLYRQGYFQQYLNVDGWQQETYPDNDFYNLPIQLEKDKDGNPVLVKIQFPGRMVYCRIWKAFIGRVSLYLLDTNTSENQERDRKITYQLYGGDAETRIQQEIILGIGGMLALRQLGLHVRVCHMNEGHAGFMAFERIRHRKVTDNLSADEALQIVRGGTIFTTHTPVPAGIDEFPSWMVEKYLGHIAGEAGIDFREVMKLGRRNPGDEKEPFNMALMALRTTCFANGVSELHGKVSRKMWHNIWPNVPIDEIPIQHVTNGIHYRSWISNEMADLFSRYLGPDWINKPADQTVWQRVEKIPDIELWRTHERRRERLVAFTRNRLAEQLTRRGVSRREINMAGEALNPEALTIGFARRFATYKRATLLLKDPDRLRKLLLDRNRPVQFIFAGKAHPKDNGGKELIRELIHFARHEDARLSIVFLENYDINVARYLVQGVDVWLNTPRRPMEASGTSGMKILPNGGLNLSVLDGWWCEGYETDTGWAIGAGEEYDDSQYQDIVESKALFDVVENDIVPLFYDRGKDNIPRGWISKVKNSMVKLCPVFNTNRMVKEYAEKFYLPVHNYWKNLSADDFVRTRNLVNWKQRIKSFWNKIRIIGATSPQKETEVGKNINITCEIDLGGLGPDDVIVQIYLGQIDSDYNINDNTIVNMKSLKVMENGHHLFDGDMPCKESGLHGYSIRIMPAHQDLTDHFDLENMLWIS